MKICYNSIIPWSEFKNMFILLHWVSRGCRNTVFVTFCYNFHTNILCEHYNKKVGFFVYMYFNIIRSKIISRIVFKHNFYVYWLWLFICDIYFILLEMKNVCTAYLDFFAIAQWTIEKKFANVWIANVIVFSFSFCKKSASHPLPARLPGGSSFF